MMVAVVTATALVSCRNSSGTIVQGMAPEFEGSTKVCVILPEL